MAPAPLIERNASPDPTDLKPPSDVIIPPKDLRSSLEKVAVYVARNGHTFEQRILDQSGGQSKFQFLIPDNPYNPYYLWRVSECKEGRTIDTSANQNGAAHGSKKKAGPEAPPEFHFSARMPNMSAVDLETVKLTALFVAKNGRPWMTALSQKEISNPNFAFLRPQHSWHSFFMRIVDQYTELLNGDIKDGGKPERERMQKMQTNVDNKYHILEDARKRAQWVKHQEAQKAKKEEEEEKEKIEFAQIDWHDFTVQATIVFDENDDQIQLPRPTSLEELQNSSLEQKAQMSLAPSNMRIEETMPGDEDFLPMGYQNQSQPQSAAPTPVQQTPMAVPPHPKQPYQSMSPAAASPYAPPPQAMPHEDEEFSRIAERQAQQQRAEAARAAASGQGPMRIRNDYVPRAQARRQNAQTAICPNCGQAIPTAEMDQHLRSK